MGRKFGYQEGDLPITEETSGRLLRLPLYYEIRREEQDRVIETVTSFLTASRSKPRRIAETGRAAPRKLNRVFALQVVTTETPRNEVTRQNGPGPPRRSRSSSPTTSPGRDTSTSSAVSTSSSSSTACSIPDATGEPQQDQDQGRAPLADHPGQCQGQILQKIGETTVSDPGWAGRHWSTLRLAYARPPTSPSTPIGSKHCTAAPGELESLSRINHLFLTELAALLGITTAITWDTEYPAMEGKTERLLPVPGGGGNGLPLRPRRPRLHRARALRTGRRHLHWMDYAGYPEYPQLHPPFEHGVSVLDLLFNVGPQAARYLERGPTP